jgi:hypothetical protein
VIRTVGDTFEPRVFSTHSPCAIALIGKLPDTLADRSVAVSLKRRLPDEPISQFRIDKVDALRTLARKSARWTADNAKRFVEVDPELPIGIYNRAADNWRPLFSVAEVAGGDWPDKARRAALPATGVPDDSLKTELLADIRDAFSGKESITSDDLVTYLVGLEERPWSESNHGKPISKNQLARRLNPFGLRPKTIRFGIKTAKGYWRDDFDKTCARYLNTAFSTVKAVTPNKTNGLDDNQTVTCQPGVPVVKSRNASIFNDVEVVTGETGESGGCARDGDRCAQCRGKIDGTERLFLDPDGESVWLHPECKRYFRERG